MSRKSGSEAPAVSSSAKKAKLSKLGAKTKTPPKFRAGSVLARQQAALRQAEVRPQ